MFTIPVFIIIFIIFIVWTQYEMKKSSKKNKEIEEAFLAREEEANHAPKQDISDLELLSFDENDIPMPPEGMFTNEDDITTYIRQIKNLIKEPMIDLSEFSNTDLKLKYGVANFTTLSEYDENYSSYLLLLTNLARGYARRELYELSEKTYKYALSCGSIKLHDYTGLAEVYLATDRPQEISSMIEEIEGSEITRKEGIINELKKVLAKY